MKIDEALFFFALITVDFHSSIKIKRIKIYSVIPLLKQSLLQVKYDIQTFLFGGVGGIPLYPHPPWTLCR